MTQIFNMEPNEVRDLAREYLQEGVTSRAIQCFERLLWLGELRRYEYLRLAAIYNRQGNETNAKRVLGRCIVTYNN